MKQVLLTSAVRTDDLPGRIGALNTLRRTSAGWEGRNFDVDGFLDPLRRRSIVLRGQRVVVVGAGGAARGVVWGLRSAGAQVAISARRREQAQLLAREFQAEAEPWPPQDDWDVLVNTTPVGTAPNVDAIPVDERVFGRAAGKIVYDLVYNPEETAFLRAAQAAGARTIGGLDMLVSQACRQFEWWTDRPAPRAVMERAAREFLGGAR